MKNKNQVRIIGGLWRGHKLEFPDLKGLRPTPDRVKETLFNWLNFHIANTNCLDLFTGSGNLGIEALSRGANHVTFVDQSYLAIQSIRQFTETHNVTSAHFVHGSVPKLTLDAMHTFDIVFIDPPYKQGLINVSINWLEHHHYLSHDAYVYIERAIDDEPLHLPRNWSIIKDQKAGQVNYLLIKRSQ